MHLTRTVHGFGARGWRSMHAGLHAGLRACVQGGGGGLCQDAQAAPSGHATGWVDGAGPRRHAGAVRCGSGALLGRAWLHAGPARASAQLLGHTPVYGQLHQYALHAASALWEREGGRKVLHRTGYRSLPSPGGLRHPYLICPFPSSRSARPAAQPAERVKAVRQHWLRAAGHAAGRAGGARRVGGRRHDRGGAHARQHRPGAARLPGQAKPSQPVCLPACVHGTVCVMQLAAKQAWSTACLEHTEARCRRAVCALAWGSAHHPKTSVRRTTIAAAACV